MLRKFNVVDSSENDLAFRRSTIPTTEHLPLQVFLPTSGLLVNVRSIRHDEDRTAYRVFRETIDRGEGFPLHSCPSLELFRQLFIMNGLCYVYEDATSGAILGWYHFSPSSITRSPSASYCQASCILGKEYQVGRGECI